MENSFKFGKRCGHLQSLQNDFCYKLCTQCAILFLYQVSLLFLLTERQNTVFLTKIKIIQHLPQSRLHFKLLEIYFLEPKKRTAVVLHAEPALTSIYYRAAEHDQTKYKQFNNEFQIHLLELLATVLSLFKIDDNATDFSTPFW